jgi:hypothetical protein
VIFELFKDYNTVSNKILVIKIVIVVSRETTMANTQVCYRNIATIRARPYKFRVSVAVVWFVEVIWLISMIDGFGFGINRTAGTTTEVDVLGVDDTVVGHL